MKRPRGGSLFLVLTPDELVSRIATLVPPPRTHALRYHGVFAPNSKHRKRVVPAGGGAGGGPGQAPARSAVPGPSACPAEPRSKGLDAEPPSFHLTSPDQPAGRQSPRYRVPWADLLKKVFAIDVLECPRCAGRLEVIAFIAEAAVAKRILEHLNLASQAPPLARAQSPDDVSQVDDGPDYDAGDPIHDE
jgi:hypothetical protein